jgi:hypothetical protein
MAGQDPVSAWPTALLTCRGRAAAAVCSPPNRLGPPEPTTQDHHQPNDHAAWSPPPCPAHGRAPRRQPAQDAPAGGLVSTWVFSCPQPTDRHPGAGPAHLSARRQGGAAACGRVMRRPRSAGDPRASHPRPTQHHPFPSGPYAGGRPRRPRTTAARRIQCAQRDGRPHRAIPGPARCGQRGGRAADTGGPSVRTPGWHRSRDTGRVDTGRPRDRLDGRPHGGQADADRTTTGVAGVRTSSRPATTRWRPDLSGVAASGGAWPPITAPR